MVGVGGGRGRKGDGNGLLGFSRIPPAKRSISCPGPRRPAPFPLRKRAQCPRLGRMRKAPYAILLLAAAGLACLSGGLAPLGALGGAAPEGAPGTHRTYTTRFPADENPVSEGATWECGRAAGVDWADVATAGGRACGLESGVTGYDDATALLTGPWGPNQAAQATVYSVNPNDRLWEEVELRLRSSLSAHSATGYEILFRCSKSDKAYTDIVRWDGPLGKFTYLSHKVGAKFGVATGDVVKATMVGNVITAYRNGVQVARVTDDTFAAGRPGMGFFLQGGKGANRDYGFTSFTATDE